MGKRKNTSAPIEWTIPFDSADYLNPRPVTYPEGSDKLTLDDGTVIDLNEPSPLAD